MTIGDTHCEYKPTRDEEFRRELAQLVNKYSLENGSDTPDFLLAEFMNAVLRLLDVTIRQREDWYGRTANQRRRL